jgi:hypothetical protein
MSSRRSASVASQEDINYVTFAELMMAYSVYVMQRALLLHS